jgi:hypothetical protein
MDEAFAPLHGIVNGMCPTAEIRDDDLGMHSYITRVEIEAPVELDVTRDEHGRLEIGSTPPLYYVNTSLRPSFHRLRVVREVDREEPEAG